MYGVFDMEIYFAAMINFISTYFFYTPLYSISSGRNVIERLSVDAARK